MLNNPQLKPYIGQLPNSRASSQVLQLFVQNAITLLLGGAAVIFLFVVLWGAYEVITAGGDKEGTSRGSKRITFGLVGLGVIMSVFAFVYLLNVIFGINLLQIQIPMPRMV